MKKSKTQAMLLIMANVETAGSRMTGSGFFMFTEILSFFSNFITSTIDKGGYPVIFFLMLVESALIPIPSEITMPFSGFLVSAGRFNLWIVSIIGALGNLAGSLIAYGLGYWLEESVFHNLIKKYGKYLLISVREVERSERWFRKYGEIITFVSRLLPAVRTVISLPAGISQMNLTKFIIYTTLGSFLWSFVLTYIGMILGQNWHCLGPIFHKFDFVIVILFLLGIGFYIYRHLKTHKEGEEN